MQPWLATAFASVALFTVAALAPLPAAAHGHGGGHGGGHHGGSHASSSGGHPGGVHDGAHVGFATGTIGSGRAHRGGCVNRRSLQCS